ncbi:conserved membrane hypothetical protein [Burkholderiales bacterium]|nr:conserved membrane hypothetical protein [Burkholderiales bacterium]
MEFLASRYDPWLVASTIAVASFAWYVALDLAERVRGGDRVVATAWLIGGSLSAGTGIWSMHFVAMQVLSLPVAIGNAPLPTFLSWLAAVAVSAVALWTAGRDQLSSLRLWVSALVMGALMCAMHYIGMSALVVEPAIVWNAWLLAASAGIAVVVSAAALQFVPWLRRQTKERKVHCQIAAALALGLTIGAVHYTAMAAASFAAGTLWRSADALHGNGVGDLMVMVSLVLLALTLMTSMLDARLQSKAGELIGSLRDINAQLHSANEELQQRAFHDPLTHLANRTLFEDRLMHAVARSRRDEERIAAHQQEKLAVLFIDLDGFKAVNDSLGHTAGDKVLRECAQRLRQAARDNDTVARISADEFLVLMEDVPSVAVCATMAQRMLDALAQPLQVTGRELQISASVGIAVFPDHGHQGKLIAHADAAMNAAKRAGGNGYTLFESHMNAGALEQLSLQSDLRHALERGQLHLVYQPKLDAAGDQLRGVEALLRWNHPERGLVSPDVFIPVAERFGLINALGDWIIDEACRQSRVWAQAGLQVRVALNLSPQQLRHGNLVGHVRAALHRHQVDASQLLCEITESVAMEDIRATQVTLENLEKIGVYLSIDDFGTGYSSLSYLRQLPVQELKIDRSFVNDLESSSDACAVVDAVVRLAHALGLRVVAEGVETRHQQSILQQLDCDELQGYLFARPMAASELLAWTQKRGIGAGRVAADPAPTKH